MQWFANRTTAVKLLLAFGAVLALAAFLGVYAIRGAAGVNAVATEIRTSWIPGMRYSAEADAVIADHRIAELRHVLSTDAAERVQLEARMDRNATEFLAALAHYAPTMLTAKDTALYRQLEQGFKDYRTENARIVAFSKAQETERALAVLKGQSKIELDSLRSALADIQQLNVQGADARAAEGDALYVLTRRNVVIVLALCLALGFGLAVVIARMISRPLVAAAERIETLRSLCVTNLRLAAEAMARGDLTTTIVTGTTPLTHDAADEIGDISRAFNGILDGVKGTVGAFEAATASLRTTLSDVRDSADATASASSQLQGASEEISSGAQEQASSLEETAASLEQITATIKQNADNAQQASQLAGGARDVAEKGGQVVTRAVDAMAEINASSKQIADIITTIDEIAFQTNLLALNAAVEAARAGQQGRGFAVVAGEVRSLAQRSATASKEIKGLIQDSVRKVEQGSALVNESGAQLTEIVTSVKRVTDIVNEIAAASREQAAGIDQVNRAVTQMDTVTQANASQTEELSGTSEGLAAQAEELRAMVSKFKVDADGARRAARPAPRAAAKAPAKRAGRAPAHAGAHASRNGRGEFGGRLAGVGAGALPSLDEEFEEY